VASKQAYSVACIKLFSRIWAELDALCASDASALFETSLKASATRATCARRLKIIRLDLVVSADACDSMRWRSQLDASQRLSLKVVLVEVLHALDAPVDEIPPRSVAQAQNRLLDAVLYHCQALNETVDWLVRRAAL
jgi:hypothetical protein